MFRVPTGTVMTTELLGKYMAKHKREISERYQKLQDAYENKYEISRREKKADWKPDNRIPVNFAKYIVDTMNGFFIGIPIKTTSDDKEISEYLEFLDQYNDQDDSNAELSKICSIYGSGFEMYYVDGMGNIGITYLSPMDAFMIYDDSILERPMFFVRHYKDADNVEHGSWSDGRVVQHFINRGSYQWVDEEKIHGFDGVPATEYLENKERIGIFESVLPMIEAHHKAVSEKENDVDYFADAAKEHLESATKLVEEIAHNAYAAGQAGSSQASSAAYTQADGKIESLKAELLNLASQSRTLCSAYVREKRDGYIQVCFTSPSVMGEAASALLLTGLFVIAQSGNAVLEPFYREYRAAAVKPVTEKKKKDRKGASS